MHCAINLHQIGMAYYLSVGFMGANCALRHGGMVYVLFRDGSVAAMQPFVGINPGLTSAREENWVPTVLLGTPGY